MVPGYTRLAQAATQPTHVTDVAHLFSPFTYCHPLIAYHVLLGSIDIYAYFYLQFFEIQKQNILFTLLGRHQAHFASLLTSVAQRHDLTTEVNSQCRVSKVSFLLLRIPPIHLPPLHCRHCRLQISSRYFQCNSNSHYSFIILTKQSYLLMVSDKNKYFVKVK